MAAQAAPPTIAATMDRAISRGPGRPPSFEATTKANTLPTQNWPVPPMLNMPARKANATQSPARMSGVMAFSVCCRLKAASCSLTPKGLPGSQWNG